MSNPWISKNMRKDTNNPTVAAASATTPVSKPWKVSGRMAADGLRVLLTQGTKTGAGAVSAVIQTKLPLSTDSGESGAWVAVKTVSLSNQDPTYITVNPRISGDEAVFPLGTLCRLALTCAAATTQEVEDVIVASES